MDPQQPPGALGALRDEIGADPPAGLAGVLREDELATLAQAVKVAKQRQSAALERATEDALGHLPGLVRKAVKRILR
jgi:hypothetical protein